MGATSYAISWLYGEFRLARFHHGTLAAAWTAEELVETPVDLLNALHELTLDVSADDAMTQTDWLRRLSEYGLRKHADEDQDRDPVFPLAAAGDGESAGG